MKKVILILNWAAILLLAYPHLAVLASLMHLYLSGPEIGGADGPTAVFISFDFQHLGISFFLMAILLGNIRVIRKQDKQFANQGMDPTEYGGKF